MDSQQEISIIVGGDIVPTGSGIGKFEKGDAAGLIGNDLAEIIRNSDFCVLNLEVPLSDCPDPIKKYGPNLIAPTASAKGLRAINPGAFSLANNHILDQGDAGLRSTLRTLDSVGACYFGAGENLTAASEPFVFEKDGLRVGFYACAEHEFTIASESTAGANPFDPLESLDHIAELKASCDYVIVLYHGGKEHYRYPSPQLQRVCRKIAEKGADLVVCQHSHCIGCMEEYEGGTIVYGQGNFLFDDSESEFWQTGLLLRVTFSDGLYVDYLPLRKHGSMVRLAEDDDAARILKSFRERSQQILEPGFVEAEYAQLADETLDNYLNAFTLGSRTIAFRVLNRIAGRKLARMFLSSRRALRERNYLECEAHRELFEAGLRGLSVDER